MAERQLNQDIIEEPELEVETEGEFKGTFVAVMILGGFIILSWAGVWMLYLSR